MLSFFQLVMTIDEERGGWNSSRKGGSGRSSEAYRHKNSDEKRRSLLKLRNWTPSLTLDHRDPHQIDPNVPVFLENVVFFEIERRGGFSELDCVHTAARAPLTSREHRRRTILRLGSIFMKYLADIIINIDIDNTFLKNWKYSYWYWQDIVRNFEHDLERYL